jgi:hypothetical protein
MEKETSADQERDGMTSRISGTEQAYTLNLRVYNYDDG